MKCIHCLDHLSPDLVAIGASSCGRCVQLLRELGDTVVEPPTREPGSDDGGKIGLNPKHNGKWLVWAANKRGCLRWFHTFGVQHGYPRNISQWSPTMVAVAVSAKMQGVATTRLSHG